MNVDGMILSGSSNDLTYAYLEFAILCTMEQPESFTTITILGWSRPCPERSQSQQLLKILLM